MKKKTFIVGGLVLLIFMGIGFFFLQDRLDDYYEMVNSRTLKKNHLKDDTYVWNRFTSAQEKVDDEVSSLTLEKIKSGDDDSFSSALGIIYHNFSDRKRRNQVGLSSLNEYIHEVNDSSNMKELETVINRIENELGIPIFTHAVVDLDFEDTSKNLLYFYPVSFAFGASSDYFTDDDYLLYRAYLKRAIIQLMEVYGYSKELAHQISDELIDFYQKLSLHTKSSEDLSDVGNLYHKVEMSEMCALYSHLDMVQYFTLKNENNLVYNLIDQVQYQNINAYFTSEYLEIWKKHLLVMILSNYASYLSDDYAKVVLRLQAGIQGGAEKKIDDLALDGVINLFSSEISSLYAKRYENAEKKEYLQKMFVTIKNTYREMILANSWLSEETKEKACLKLDKMKIQIGDLSRDEENLKSLFDDVQFEEGNLVQNVFTLVQMRNREQIDKLSSNDLAVSLDERQVNAYYHASSQTVYVPLALYHLFSLSDDYFTNLGSVGMILAHEVSHAFDWNGSFYDESGIYREWWQKKDRENYQILKKQVIDYYSKYEVLNGRFVNGEHTVNENIADLGAVHCISNIFLAKNGTRLQAKKMYESYARLWVSQEKQEYVKLLLLLDTHSPNSIRVNAVLSSTDLFYQIYHLKPWDKMYLSREKRVEVW